MGLHNRQVNEAFKGRRKGTKFDAKRGTRVAIDCKGKAPEGIEKKRSGL
jgi:hypothetical protein